jgi:glycosyltransferase involved in cell wall biosynthesis
LDAKRSYGGPVSVALGVAEEQIRNGHSVSIVALSPDTAFPYLPSGLEQRIFNVKRNKSAQKFSGLISIKALVWLWVNRNEFEIFHLHFSRDLFQVLAGNILRGSKASIIIQPHGMITNQVSAKKPYQGLYDFVLTNPAVSRASRVLALQEIEARLLKANFDCQNISIVPNGINFRDTPDESLRSQELVIFISRLHPQKNPHLFVDAAINLIRKGTNLEFAIGGTDGGLSDEISSAIRETNSDQLEFLGSLENSEVLDLLKRAKLLVLPSIDEQYPMIVLEALSRGVIVVLSSSSGLAPIIERNKLGYIYDSKRETLEQAILNAMSNSARLDRVRERAESIFEISSVVASLESVYKECQNKRHSG